MKMTGQKKVMVAKISNRNQTTLPSEIRHKMGITGKRSLFVWQSPFLSEETVILSIEPPVKKTYKAIKISDKGQIVIPSHYRDSLGITLGDNIVFSIVSNMIELPEVILFQKMKDHENVLFTWDHMINVIEIVSLISKNISVRDSSILVLGLTVDDREKTFIERIRAIEGILGVKLMISRKDKKLLLTPVK